MPWSRVIEEDSWGDILTYWKDRKQNGERMRFPLNQKQVRVCFPNGIERMCRLVLVDIVQHINDMGHESTVCSPVPHVRMDLWGQPILIRLGQSKLRVWWEKEKQA